MAPSSYRGELRASGGNAIVHLNPANYDALVHEIAVLALPPVVAFDLAVPCQVFDNPRPDSAGARYRVRVCAREQGRVATTTAGLDLFAESGLAALGAADTIVVPGFDYRADVP